MAPRPNYGISRIEQEEKKNFGWNVRVTYNGETTHKYFPDKSCGGKNKALKLAREFRDGVVKKLPKVKQEAASRALRKVKKSGVTGVTHVVSTAGGGKSYEYWQAAWEDKEGARRTAKYSIGRYGNKEALELAIQARKDALRGKSPKRPPRVAADATKPGKKSAAKKKTAALGKTKKAATKKAAAKAQSAPAKAKAKSKKSGKK
ncbi:MAG: AP2 domain-containing protein [Verrucomicrobiales bacterium]